jgi:hypothetical protein
MRFPACCLVVSLLGTSPWLSGCGAIPFLLGLGGAAAVRAGETLVFPNASAAIVPWPPSEVRRATFDALAGFGIAKVLVQEHEGGGQAIEGSLDGRKIVVTIAPALDARASRVEVQARSDWLQTDVALQAALLAAIREKLTGLRSPGLPLA